jgi:low temperature requirement protein LtrA
MMVSPSPEHETQAQRITEIEIERCGSFIIIALGESILVAGATFARNHPGRGG